MNENLSCDKIIVVVGCGAEPREFFSNHKPIFTDVTPNKWIDMVLGANYIGFADNLVDIFIYSSSIHNFHPQLIFSCVCQFFKTWFGGLIVLGVRNF